MAVEVFAGDTADPATLGAQIDKLRTRFGLTRVVLVGDRGLLTSARIREEVEPAGLDWISALRAPAIRQLASGGTLQPSLFDQRDLAEIHHPDFPGERLIACRNPLLAERRARKREALLRATERDLGTVLAATRRQTRPLKGRDKIGLRIGRVIARHKMAKHIDLEIADDGFTFRRNQRRIAEEAALDGIYVIRTSLPETDLGAHDTVRAYKSLSRVERAFRSFKTVDLKVRPVYHYRPERVRAHVFLCMLAYHVEWHMRRTLAPLLFDDEDPPGAEAARPLGRGPGHPFARGPSQGGHEAHPPRRPGAQLPDPARRSGDHRQEPHPTQTDRSRALRGDHPTDRAPAPSPRPARPAPVAFPVRGTGKSRLIAPKQ